MTTPGDVCVASTLREVALRDHQWNARECLVALWRLSEEEGLDVARTIFRRGATDADPLRRAAIKLLAKSGDSEALAEKARLEGVECRALIGSDVIGILWPDDFTETYEERAIGPEPTVALICPNSPASKAGFKLNDRVVNVNGQGCQRSLGCWRLLKAAREFGRPVDVTVQTAGGATATRRVPGSR